MKSKSRVIGIRLSEADEDEARALEYIERLEQQGFDLKQIVLPAILQRANIEPVNPQYLLQRVSELLVSMDNLKDVVDNLKKAGTISFQPHPEPKPSNTSNEVGEQDPMIQALMKRAKPGKRFDK